MAANASERFALISESLAEILNPELIEKVLAEGRNPRIYWGTFHDSPSVGR
jgi:tyrosyl-tRNA synthetase